MDDLSTTCRLCLRSCPGDLVNLFEMDNGVVYSEMILDLMSIVVEDTQNWPPNACYDCIELLEKLAEFQDLIVSSHKNLYAEIYRSYGQESNTTKELPNKDILKVEADTDTEMVLMDSKKRCPAENASSDSEISWPSDPDYIASESLDESVPKQKRKNKQNDTCSDPDTCTPELQDDGVPKRKYKTRVKKEFIKERIEEEEMLESVMQEMTLFICRICEKDCESFSLLGHHVNTDHKHHKYEFCCDHKLALGRQKSFDHIRRHLDKDVFKCNDCGKRYNYETSLKAHMDTNHSSKPPTHICAVCGKDFWTIHSYEKHMQIHDKDNVCKYCKIAFRNKFKLNLHIKSHHELEINALCYLCGRGFAASSLLLTHIRDHGGPHGGNRRKKTKFNPSGSKASHFDKEYFKQN